MFKHLKVCFFSWTELWWRCRPHAPGRFEPKNVLLGYFSAFRRLSRLLSNVLPSPNILRLTALILACIPSSRKCLTLPRNVASAGHRFHKIVRLSLCLCDSPFVHPVAQLIQRWGPGQKTPVRVAPALDIALPAGMVGGATCQNGASSLLYVSQKS